MRVPSTVAAVLTSTLARLGLALLRVSLGTSGCAGVPRTPQRATLRARPLSVATAEDLSKCVGLSLYECLQSTRPTLIPSRGESVTVFVDGVLWGPATSLRQLRAADVMQARLLTDREPGTWSPPPDGLSQPAGRAASGRRHRRPQVAAQLGCRLTPRFTCDPWVHEAVCRKYRLAEGA
jgi:hypothetical protein